MARAADPSWSTPTCSARGSSRIRPSLTRTSRSWSGRVEFVSFQTVAEIRFGAQLRGWGNARLARMEAEIAHSEVVHSGTDLIAVYADLRVACYRAGHALGQREHDADRWIAATARRLGVPLVSNDGVFRGAPGLELETLAP